jgi:SRSO17 transposase
LIEALQDFERYMGHLSEGLGHADRHAGLRGYCTGLMSPLSRKSVEPMAAHVDPLKVRSRHQSLHHFVADANWSDEQMLLRVCQWVVPQMDFNDVAGGSLTTRVSPSRADIRRVWRVNTAGCWASRTTARWP